MYEINYLAVIVAAVASFVVGFLWYGPVFGKKWMAMMNFTPESMKSMKLTPTQAMIKGFVITLISVWAISTFVSMGLSVSGAAMLTLLAWLAFTMPTTLGAYLWEGRSFKLALFNSAYQLVNLFVVILVLTSL